MNRDEQQWWEIIDHLDEKTQAELLRHLHHNEALPADFMSERQLRQIEQRTFAKIDLPPKAGQRPPQRHKVRRRKALRVLPFGAAAAAVVIVALVAIPGPVSAALHRLMGFVPGFGVVQETPNGADLMVLSAPVQGIWLNQPITVSGMMVTQNEIDVKLTAKEDMGASVQVVTAQGKTYKLSGSRAGATSQWVGDYSYRGPVTGFTDAKVVIGVSQPCQIPVHLTPAKTASALSQFGPTDTHNGITLAAVAKRVGKQVNLTFLEHHDGSYRVMDDAPYSMSTGRPDLRIVDSQKRTYPASSVMGFEPNNQFTFAPKPDVNDYQVTIPQVSADYTGSVRVRLPVPKQGSETIDKTVQLAGFPVTFTKEEWADNKHSEMRVYVDLHASINADKELYTFRPAGSFSGWESRINSKTGAMEWLQFPVHSGARGVTLHLTNPQVYIRGPWTFAIHLPPA